MYGFARWKVCSFRVEVVLRLSLLFTVNSCSAKTHAVPKVMPAHVYSMHCDQCQQHIRSEFLCGSYIRSLNINNVEDTLSKTSVL